MMQQPHDAHSDRGNAAYQEYLQSHQQRVEIRLTAEAERMLLVRAMTGRPAAHQQQKLVHAVALEWIASANAEPELV